MLVFLRMPAKSLVAASALAEAVPAVSLAKITAAATAEASLP
jgi:hypothetical protein